MTTEDNGPVRGPVAYDTLPCWAQELIAHVLTRHATTGVRTPGSVATFEESGLTGRADAPALNAHDLAALQVQLYFPQVVIIDLPAALRGGAQVEVLVRPSDTLLTVCARYAAPVAALPVRADRFTPGVALTTALAS